MITARPRCLAAVLASAALLTAVAVPGPAAAATYDGRTVLSVGHADAMQVVYENGELGLRVKDDTGDSPRYRDPADVLFQVLPEAETAIPAGDQFAFLGEAGDPMWLLPLSQDPELLWPGWSTEPLARGQFRNDSVTMSLVGVDGPGDVVLWTVQNLGQPVPTFSSRDGLPDSLGVNVPSHVHSYWSFTAAGSYTLTWKVTGTLAGGAQVSSGNVDYHWHVGALPDEPPAQDPDGPDLDGRLVLDHGHVDVLSAHLDGDQLSLRAKDDTRIHDPGTVYRDPDDIALHAVPESKTVLTDAQVSQPGWDRLGEAGDTVWWLPDYDKSGILFPGWSTTDIASGLLKDNAISLSLTDVDGPGDLMMFQVDDFAGATVLADSRDGLPDAVGTRASTHAHANWFFTEPGIYTLTWRAEARLPDGTPIQSPPEQYVFVVDEWPADEPGNGGDDPALENTQTITATIDGDTGGLILSVDPTDRNVDLPALALNTTATRWTTSGDLRPVTVTDTRTADPGWNVTGQVSDFTSADSGFGGAHLGWLPGITSSGANQDVRPGPAVAGLLDGGPGLSAPQILAQAPAGAGNGTAVLHAELRLDLPTDVESGTYTALVTFTAI